MNIKTGIDIIEVNRIQESIEKYGDSFLNRIYTIKEIAYCEKKGVHKYESYAVRFAAKEAVFKSISKYLNNKYDIEWNNIEILNDGNGRPFVHLSDTLLGKLNEKNLQFDISLSHTKETAIASVLNYC